ncbi:hypothetical protein ACLM5J_16965 [Nocardioides sp. Bht2]
MYSNYPDWGPAIHHPENPRSREAIQQVIAARDTEGFEPDDN